MAAGRASDIADQLLDIFGTLDAVLTAEASACALAAAHPSSAQHLHAIGSALNLVLRNRVIRGPVLANGTELIDYLTFTASHPRVETIRVLFLNSRHELLRGDLLARGSTTEACLPIRNILKRAIELEADSFLFVHNHPSGDPTPSRVDKEITRQLAAAARTIGIPLLDHIIVSRGAWFSFHEQGLL